MKVSFTKHFWDNWKKREPEINKLGVDINQLIQFVLIPDIIMKDPKIADRDWRIKKLDGRCLRIVTESKEDEIVVVTAFLDRTLRRKGICR